MGKERDHRDGGGDAFSEDGEIGCCQTIGGLWKLHELKVLAIHESVLRKELQNRLEES